MYKQNDRLMSTAEVLSLIPISRTTLWRFVQEKLIAPPRKLGTHRIAWLASDIQVFIQGRNNTPEDSHDQL